MHQIAEKEDEEPSNNNKVGVEKTRKAGIGMLTQSL